MKKVYLAVTFSKIRYIYSRLIRERLSLESVKAYAILVEAGLPLLDESFISAQWNNETTKIQGLFFLQR